MILLVFPFLWIVSPTRAGTCLMTPASLGPKRVPGTFENTWYFFCRYISGGADNFIWVSRSCGWSSVFFLFVLFCFCFLGPNLWHMEVPGLGVELELQLPAYTTATAMQDLSLVCDLHHNSWQHQIPDPLSKARDWTHTLMVTSRICFCYTTTGTPYLHFRDEIPRSSWG